MVTSTDRQEAAVFLGGAVKGKCYVDKPEPIEHLKVNIHDAIDKIQPHKL